MFTQIKASLCSLLIASYIGAVTTHVRAQNIDIRMRSPITRSQDRFANEVAEVIAHWGMSGNAAGTEESDFNGDEIVNIHDLLVTMESIPASDTGILVDFEMESNQRLSVHQTFAIESFPLDARRQVDLALERFDVVLPGGEFVAVDDRGELILPSPQVTLLRGKVIGHENSWVYLAVTSNQMYGVINLGQQEEYLLVPLRERLANGEAANHLLYEKHSAFRGAPPKEPFCKTPGPKEPIAVTPMTATAGSPPLRTAWLALDCDWEYRNLFTSVNDAQNYTVALAGFVSAIYQRDLNVRIFLKYLRIWDTASDPWKADNTDDALNEFRDYWNANHSGNCRHLAHFLSGKTLGGGLAWVDELCTSRAYGVNGNLDGNLPMPPPNPGSLNNDLVILAHEMGHNFGAEHTHCYNPPIDTCAGDGFDCPNPQTCQQGTLMSYCFLCTGGMASMSLNFHSVVINDILGDINGSCLIVADDPMYVSAKASGCDQNGTQSRPFQRVLYSESALIPQGTVYIRPGTYQEPWTYTEPMTLRIWPGFSGDATIGP